MYVKATTFRRERRFSLLQPQLQQTNIVQIDEGTGGVTEAFKNRLMIFNDGSEEWLSIDLPRIHARKVQSTILYGGWWKFRAAAQIAVLSVVDDGRQRRNTDREISTTPPKYGRARRGRPQPTA